MLHCPYNGVSECRVSKLSTQFSACFSESPFGWLAVGWPRLRLLAEMATPRNVTKSHSGRAPRVIGKRMSDSSGSFDYFRSPRELQIFPQSCIDFFPLPAGIWGLPPTVWLAGGLRVPCALFLRASCRCCEKFVKHLFTIWSAFSWLTGGWSVIIWAAVGAHRLRSPASVKSFPLQLGKSQLLSSLVMLMRQTLATPRSLACL